MYIEIYQVCIETILAQVSLTPTPCLHLPDTGLEILGNIQVRDMSTRPSSSVPEADLNHTSISCFRMKKTIIYRNLANLLENVLLIPQTIKFEGNTN